MKTDAVFDASFERSVDEEGAWLYSDPEVHECWTIWLMFYGFNLYELDNYL